jgi:hypothetical protein
MRNTSIPKKNYVLQTKRPGRPLQRLLDEAKTDLQSDLIHDIMINVVTIQKEYIRSCKHKNSLLHGNLKHSGSLVLMSTTACAVTLQVLILFIKIRVKGEQFLG